MKTFLLILLSASILHSSARAQTAASPIVSDARQELRLGPGDLLSLSVYDCPELTQELRVAADGTIRLALLGDLDVHGMTASEGAQKIERELRDRNLVRNPQVSLAVKEFATQAITVEGEAQRPGIFPVYGPRNLIDVIAMAGGLSNFADVKITIKRKSSDKTEIVIVKQDDGGATASAQVSVFPGDTVVIPRAGIVYVLGDVTRPGGFVMHDNGAMSVLQALAEAEGPQHTASLHHAVWIRKSEGASVPHEIDLKPIMKGKASDPALAAGDILYLPSAALKQLGQNTSGIISSMSGASIYAISK